LVISFMRAATSSSVVFWRTVASKSASPTTTASRVRPSSSRWPTSRAAPTTCTPRGAT
jgi:hypothetical protein